MSIANYGELKTAVTDWLNRTAPEIVNRSEDFIRLGEADILRFLANRTNEVSATVDRTSEDPVTGTIPVPSNYREMLTFTVDGRPIQRVSLTRIQTLLDPISGVPVGIPQYFAREEDVFLLSPFPDAGRVYDLLYYSKLAAFTQDTDSNELLVSEPGVYLYGALRHAEPFVRGDNMAIVQEWKQNYANIMEGLAIERDEEDRSGSSNEVLSSFGSGSNIMRTGWA